MAGRGALSELYGLGTLGQHLHTDGVLNLDFFRIEYADAELSSIIAQTRDGGTGSLRADHLEAVEVRLQQFRHIARPQDKGHAIRQKSR